MNPITGNLVPTDGCGKRRSRKEEDATPKRGLVPASRTERLFFGATYLLDQDIDSVWKNIPSQRSIELFHSITEEAKMHFFRLQGKRRAEKEYWAYDSTSISSRLEMPKQVKYGKNKDGDHLPQINLALISNEESKLPFYYRKIAGNVPDVKTVRELLRELDVRRLIS